MSRRGVPPSFASRGMFDALADDEVDDVEEEEEEEVVQPKSEVPESSTSPSTPLSKSARKRLARANKAAPSSVSDKSAPISEAVQHAIPTTDDVKAAAEIVQKKIGETINGAADAKQAISNVVEKTVNETKDPFVPKKEEPSVPLSADDKDIDVPAANGNGNAVQARPSPKTIGSSFTPPEPVPSTASIIAHGERKSSFSKPPSTAFSPDLPETLPQPSGNALPANRKRKTPTDFTPSGPVSETPSSPSKIGVKFEDGLAPGEGKEGEKIITPKKEAKNRNVIERTVMTFVMIAGFILLLCAGHPFMIVLVMICQTLVYKEVTALFELRDEGSKKIDESDKWSKTLNWYFFVVTNYFLYGESIIYYFKHIVFVDAYFIPFARNHRFISFMLYVVGFVGFVGNLDKRFLRQQFALFCWVHISLLLIVVSSHFIVNNILEGQVWFFVPASLVICNDVMAYVCGKLFGRTPLIKLSPKKTVEGFVGAFICTLIFGLAWGTFFMRFPYMICPARDLGTNVFSQITCRPNPVFVWRDFEFSGLARKALETILGHAPPAIPYAPFQIHCLVMATFASLVAPFGGFFASGFKRAFNIKDFGTSIPGHGGMTDRMDCQFMMGMFAYVYYSSLIRIQYVTVGSIMQTVVTSLSASEQLELLADLKRFLEGQGIRVKV